MTKEECEGCEYCVKGCSPFAVNRMRTCTHPNIFLGLGVWIARVKECPKGKDGEQV